MNCPVCGARSDDGMVCPRCAARCQQDLSIIPGLWGELEITLTRQGQTGTGNGGRSAETALPFDQRASEIGAEVKMTMVNWVRTFELGDKWPADDVGAICGWLSEREQRWRGHAEGGEFGDEMADVVRRLRVVIDLRPEMVYLGACDNEVEYNERCLNQMYARRSDDVYVCAGAKLMDPETSLPTGARRPCGKEYDVDERREYLMSLARDQSATIGLCTRMLTMFGFDCKVETVWNWTRPRPRRDGVLPPKLWRTGTNEKGESVYRIGDVEALVIEWRDQQEAKRQHVG